MRSSVFILCAAAAIAGTRLGAQVMTPGAQSSGVQARAGRHGQHGGGARALLRGISLTDAQRSQLTGIERRYRDEHRAHRGTGAGRGAIGADTASRAARRATRQREFADVRGVLTPDQQSVFDRNLQQWQASARQRRADRRTGSANR